MKRALGWGLLALTLLAGCVPEQQVQTGGQCVPKPAFQAPPVDHCRRCVAALADPANRL